MRREGGPAASVLVYSMGEVLGDGLMKLAVVGALQDAFPRAHLSWCAAKGATVYAGPLAPVVEGRIHEILTAKPTGAGEWDWLTARSPFGGREFDVVIDTQDNLRRSIVARRAAKQLFVSGAGGGLLSHRRPARPQPEHVVERLTALVSLAAGRPVSPRPLPVHDERSLAAAEAMLPAGPRYVGFAPGAGGESRRWPLDRYVELALRQTARGRMPVFFLGPREALEVLTVRSSLPHALLPEFDRTDAFADVEGPRLVMALASRLSAAVANDAGPGHMLAAGGAPLVSLQLDHRKARKFRPAARRLEMLVAEDYEVKLTALERRYGSVEPEPEPGMRALPLLAVEQRLERLLGEAS